MPEKASFLAGHETEIFGTSLAFLGGLLFNLSELAEGKRFSALKFVVNILSSGFFGLLTVYVCQALGQSEAVMGAASGVSGYLGSRAWKLLAVVVKARYGVDLSFEKPVGEK